VTHFASWKQAVAISGFRFCCLLRFSFRQANALNAGYYCTNQTNNSGVSTVAKVKNLLLPIILLFFTGLSINAHAGPQPPVADAGGPYEGTVGVEVSFDGSGSTDPNGDETIVSYEWAFGDGGTGSGATATHTYTSAGTFDVTLTVTDEDNEQDTDTTTATICPCQTLSYAKY